MGPTSRTKQELAKVFLHSVSDLTNEDSLNMTTQDRSDPIAIEVVDEKADASHIEEAEGHHDAKKTTTDAMVAEEAEHAMPLFEAVKVYKSAILWSMAISLVIVMDGYDTGCESLLPRQILATDF